MGPWFSLLEAWNGQSLALERVAWLRLSGIPLHLLSSEVLGLVSQLFGKVLHIPKSFEEDQNLSLVRVGVLAGEGPRIEAVVSLRWSNRCFRVRVEEELDVWNPDCLGPSVVNGADAPSSPSMSSPIIDVLPVGNQQEVGPEEDGDGSVPVDIVSSSHVAWVPMQKRERKRRL
ncbi:hypothetical protein HanIR_Chr09g0416091 [Helianthus annuus]|nr:hypothetical protein HanIR_Chr09g0416091 [Helianthus annuus]